MAKMDSAAVYNEFLAKVVAAIPEDKRAAFEETLKDPEVTKAATPFVMTRSDYSRSMDELAAEKSQLTADKDRWTQWYGTASTEVAAIAAAKVEADAKIAAYEAVHGPLGADDKSKVKSGVNLDEVLAKVREENDKRDMASFKVLSIVNGLTYDHQKTFGEKLDMDELVGFATKQNLPLTTAYREWVAPRLEEKAKEAHKTEIEKAKADAIADYASKHNLPLTTAPREANIFTPFKEHVVENDLDRQRRIAANFSANINRAR